MFVRDRLALKDGGKTNLRTFSFSVAPFFALDTFTRLKYNKKNGVVKRQR
jgi:hypothetical protein